MINKKWLGREDSNLRMQGPKPCVLPLDDAPSTHKKSANESPGFLDYQARLKNLPFGTHR